VESVDLTLRNVSHARPFKGEDLSPLPDVVIFEIDGQESQDLADIEHLMQARHEELTVFVTYKQGDVPTMRRLMRAGVRDVFEQPIRTQEMVLAVTQALSEKRGRQEQSRGGKAGITAFIDAKGGSGSTTLAVNVAELLARRHQARVALIDLDLQFGSAALSLDLNPRDTGLRALRDSQRLDKVFLDALMTHHDSGLHVLASPVTVVPAEGVSEEGVARLLETAAENYEFVIVDLSRGLSEWEQLALRMADPVVLVLQNNLATIRDAKLLLDKLPAMGVPLSRVEIVINRAEGKSEHISDSQLATALEGRSVHRVRNDYDTAATAQDEGAPVEDVGKRSTITKDIAALADFLFTVHQGETKQKTGVFGRLFGHH
jgi:pilus assembly protein CpaE